MDACVIKKGGKKHLEINSLIKLGIKSDFNVLIWHALALDFFFFQYFLSWAAKNITVGGEAFMQLLDLQVIAAKYPSKHALSFKKEKQTCV